MPKNNNSIIVVDDDHDLRRTICDFLVRTGYRVHQAADGYNAIKLLTDEQPDLVITDILMPDKEGISTIIDIRKSYNDDIKIIAISGGGRFGRVNLLKSAHKLGADAVIPKPFDFDELHNTIETVLNHTV